jgi:hypothetical protein
VPIALVTCIELPRPDPDLPILRESFARRGVSAEVVVWNDPTIDWSRFDAVVVRSTWDYVANLGAFARWIDEVERVTRLVNSAPILRWNLHKRYLLDLSSSGVDIIPTTLVPAGGTVDWAALFARHGDLVLKPAISAGSFATVRVGRGEEAAAVEHVRSHGGRDFLVQPLLRSVVEHGETNIVCFGGRPSHAIHKGARWSGQAEQSRGLVAPTAAELDLAARTLAAVEGLGLGVPAYARVDCAAGPDGRPLLMELELLEPALFLDRLPSAADALVAAVLAVDTSE